MTSFDHLIKIRELQKKTNGFVTLIPLKFSLDNIRPLTLSLASPPCMLSDGGQGLLAKMSWK